MGTNDGSSLVQVTHFMRSIGLGLPSWILSTDSQGMPAVRRALAVPVVATRPKPRLPRSLAIAMMSGLFLWR